MTNAGAGNFIISGGAGTDTLTGGGGDDTFKINLTTEGNSDTVDGKGGANTLELSTGVHTLTNNSKLVNIQTIKTNSSGSQLDLTNQSEDLSLIHI